MQLRGAQVSAHRNQTRGARPVGGGSSITSASTGTGADDHGVRFEPHEFSEEWEDYPWHLAAAFAEDDDAFWVPELAAALEMNDENAINEAVLRFFFEEHDQERLDEIDALLAANQGREDALFVELAEAYAAMQVADGGSGDAAAGGQAAGTASAQPPVAAPTAAAGAASAARAPGAATGGSAARRPSLIVSGMRRSSGWQMNAGGEDMKNKMQEAGENSQVIDTVVSAASSSPPLPPQ